MKVGDPVEVAIANPREIKDYWGYSVSTANSFRQAIENDDWDMRIATSKKGSPLGRVSKEITSRLKEASSVLLVFGSPSKGLIEIARDESTRLEEITDFVVNFVPNQGTETVRTEEAVLASLAIMNQYSEF